MDSEAEARQAAENNKLYSDIRTAILGNYFGRTSGLFEWQGPDGIVATSDPTPFRTFVATPNTSKTPEQKD